MFQKLNLFFLLFLTIALASCYKDLGNYDYTPINEVHFEGIQEAYTATLGEPISITPVLKFSQDTGADTSAYTYEWIGLRLDNVLPGEQKKEIARTRNLDMVMTLPPAPYRVWYRVTDKKTGVQWQTEFNLTVVTSIFEGWLVLNDVGGKARLDMVSFINGQPKTVIDVLGTVGSKLPPQGAPKYVYTYNFQPNTYGIYLSTETGTSRIHPETFDWDPTYDIKYEMLGNVPENFSTNAIVSPTGNSAYLHAGS